MMELMPRAMRVEYPGAIYHLMDRGDRRKDIFVDDVDRRDFVTAPAARGTRLNRRLSGNGKPHTPNHTTYRGRARVGHARGSGLRGVLGVCCLRKVSVNDNVISRAGGVQEVHIIID